VQRRAPRPEAALRAGAHAERQVGGAALQLHAPLLDLAGGAAQQVLVARHVAVALLGRHLVPAERQLPRRLARHSLPAHVRRRRAGHCAEPRFNAHSSQHPVSSAHLLQPQPRSLALRAVFKFHVINSLFYKVRQFFAQKLTAKKRVARGHMRKSGATMTYIRKMKLFSLFSTFVARNNRRSFQKTPIRWCCRFPDCSTEGSGSHCAPRQFSRFSLLPTRETCKLNSSLWKMRHFPRKTLKIRTF